MLLLAYGGSRRLLRQGLLFLLLTCALGGGVVAIGLLLPQDPFYVSTSEMVRLIATAHGKKKVLIPGFGKLLSALPVSAAKKAFGSLYYAPSAEDHSVVRTLEEAIAKSEGGVK